MISIGYPYWCYILTFNISNRLNEKAKELNQGNGTKELKWYFDSKFP